MKIFFSITLFLLFFTVMTLPARTLSGKVYADNNPAAGVLVSDGDTIVPTGSSGDYNFESRSKKGYLFVITPSGYEAKSGKGFQPDFWVNLPEDTDEDSVNDFYLISRPQDNFSVIFTADTHLTDDPVKKDFTHYKNMVLPTAERIAAQKRKEGKSVYSVNLGDLSHDLYWYQNDTQVEKVVDFITEEGFPALTYSIPGNHDNDPAVIGKKVDERAIRRYRRTLGPETYSVNIGNTHWIMLDDIIYRNRPGKGKQAKGVAGDRSYKAGLTGSQFRWLTQDLRYVPDSVNVFICCHIPLLNNGKTVTNFANPEQLDSLGRMLERFGKVTVFSGHAHRNGYAETDNFRQYVFTATSGLMWETTNDFQTIGSDGSATGLWAADVRYGTLCGMDYYTYIDKDPLFRCYDLNSVGEYYSSSPSVRKFLETYPERTDYSDPKFRNMVYVNFWGDFQGRKVEILEEGKPLEVKKVRWEDPLFFISYYIPKMEADPNLFREKFRRKSNTHAYCAKTSSPESAITVNIYDNDGTLLQTESMERKKRFDKNAR